MSFLRQGYRQSKAFEKKKVKNHVKEFYKILHKLDSVADEIRKSEVEITEDNINEEASKVIGRDIDSMEKTILLGKLGYYENNIKES